MDEKTTIYLIRHSEQLKINNINNVKEDTQITNEKIILSAKGEEKAFKMSQIDELNKIDMVYSSHYVRCISTAKYIALRNNIEINVDGNLGERKLGNLNTLKNLEKDENIPYTIKQILYPKLKNIDGESMEEVRKRMTNFLNNMLNNNVGKRIVLVSHGAAIKFLLMNWCSLDKDKNIRYRDIKIDIKSPSVLKLEFVGKELKNLNVII